MKAFVELISILVALALVFVTWTVGDQLIHEGKQMMKLAESMR
jgi:hypothetical protein